MKKNILRFILLCVFAVVAFIVWKYVKSEEIEVAQTQRGKAVLAAYATGTVEASVTIAVAPRQTARLMQLHADEGQSVTKGMVIAQLEDSDLKNALNDRQSSADLAQKEYDRQLRLSKSGAISKQAFDRAEAHLQSARAMAAQAEANLSFMRLIAPEDGLIIRREGEIGEMIPVNQPVFWMSCCAGLRIAAEVDEEDISLVTPGQKVLIRADAFKERIFEGKVQSITPKGDAIARSYRVRISLDEKDTPLMIGMTAETNIIITESKNALLIPSSAVLNDQVFVVEDGRVRKQSVKTGAKADNKIEILDGLSDGDNVVVNGALDLQENQKLRTRSQTKTP